MVVQNIIGFLDFVRHIQDEVCLVFAGCFGLLGIAETDKARRRHFLVV